MRSFESSVFRSWAGDQSITLPNSSRVLDKSEVLFHGLAAFYNTFSLSRTASIEIIYVI